MKYILAQTYDEIFHSPSLKILDVAFAMPAFFASNNEKLLIITLA
jgi:hypothetical protein